MHNRPFRKCALPQCSGLRFNLVHKFPRRQEKLQQWLDAIGSQRLNNTSQERLNLLWICSRHFRVDDYVNAQSKTLNGAAIPSLNLQNLNDLDKCRQGDVEKATVLTAEEIEWMNEIKHKDQKATIAATKTAASTTSSRPTINSISNSNAAFASQVCDIQNAMREHINRVANQPPLVPLPTQPQQHPQPPQPSEPTVTTTHTCMAEEDDCADFTLFLDDGFIEINDFKLGRNYELNSLWLRSLCRCALCFDVQNCMQKINVFELPQDVQPIMANVSDETTKLEIVSWDPVDELGEQLKAEVHRLIENRQYDDVPLLFTSHPEAQKYVSCLPKIYEVLFRDVCAKYMKEEIVSDNNPLFCCAMHMLNNLAEYAPASEYLALLFELLQENSPDCVFISALRAVRITLLRLSHLDHRQFLKVFEYVLLTYIKQRRNMLLPLDVLPKLVADQQWNFCFSLFHARLESFYEPIIEDIFTNHVRQPAQVFRSFKINMRNLTCSFLLTLLNVPMGQFDLRTERHSVVPNEDYPALLLQFVGTVTKNITKRISDPYCLLSLMEEKAKYSSRLTVKTTSEKDNGNMYLMDDKINLNSLALYYYMVIAEGIEYAKVPQVYCPLYVYEKGLYLVKFLLNQLPKDQIVLDKAFRLLKKLICNLRHRKISLSYCRDVDIYITLYNVLCKLVTETPVRHVRQQALRALKSYMGAFENDSRKFIMDNFINTYNFPVLRECMIALYKSNLRNALTQSTAALRPGLCGEIFRQFLLDLVCKARPYTLKNSDAIISSIGTIGFIAVHDLDNRTGIWSLLNEVDNQFVTPLRAALNRIESQIYDELGQPLLQSSLKCHGTWGEVRVKRLKTLTKELNKANTMWNFLQKLCIDLNTKSRQRDRYIFQI